MTTDETPFTEPVQPYFQIGIPGVPFSALRAPLGTSEESMREWASWAATCAEIIANAYAEVFPSGAQDVSRVPAVPSHVITSNAPMRATPVQAAAVAPLCNLHNVPMKVSTSKAGGWFCSRKLADGTYCQERVAA